MIPLDEFVKFPQPECMQHQRRASAKREFVVSGTEKWIQRRRTWYAKHNVPFPAPVPGKHIADENGFGPHLQDAEAKFRTLVAELSQNIERTQGYLPVTSCMYPNYCQCTQHGDALPEYTKMLLHGGCAEWFPQLDQFTVKELQSLWGNSFSLARVAA